MKKLRNFGKPYTMGLLKELLIGLIILFGFSAFTNAGSVSYSAVIPAGSYNKTILYSFPLPLTNLQGGIGNVSCQFTGIDGTYTQDKQFDFSFYMVDRGNPDIGVNYGSLSAGYVKFSNFFSNSTYNYNHTNNYIYESNKYFVSFAFRSYYSFTLNSDLYISCTLSGDNVLGGGCPECGTCPEIDTGAILSGYIAISDVNDNYCISNGLCGEISTGLSTLYINDIRHESKPFIYVNIPEEFDWDYTGNVAEINIDVKGYNTDSDYIAGVINSQISKPTSEDLGNLINVVAKFVPGLVIILFIYFIFRFIKKIF